MESNKWGRKFAAIAVVFLSLFLVQPLAAQEINLDKLEKAGDLLCYPSLKDPNLFYYLPDRPRLAVKNGRPQFSFMKYARTTTTGKAGIGRAEGGGIVHFLVTYGASDDRVRAAERRLQERHPEARIVAPIVYRKGSFALITSFKEGGSVLTKTVAVGKAPLMEGQKAAVSMALTREGAEILWESFRSDTPDISLVFDMDYAGVREPYEATLEADWSRISKHHRVKAGMKYGWFGADVDMLFQELRQDGAIKITTKGKNATLDKILQSAHAKLLKVMFDPAPVDELSRAAAEKDSYSNLNTAIKMLKGSKSSSRSSRKSSLNLNDTHFKELIVGILELLIPSAHASPGLQQSIGSDVAQNDTPSSDVSKPSSGNDAKEKPLWHIMFDRGVTQAHANNYGEALEAFRESERLYRGTGEGGRPLGNIMANVGYCLRQLHRYGESEEAYRESVIHFGPNSERGRTSARLADEVAKQGRSSSPATGADNKDSQTKQTIKDDSAKGASEAYNYARRLDKEAADAGFPPDAVEKAIEAYENYQVVYTPTGARAKEVEGRLRSLTRRLSNAKTSPGSGSGSKSDKLLPDSLEKSLQGTSSSTKKPAGSKSAPKSSATSSAKAGKKGAGSAATSRSDKKRRAAKASPAAKKRSKGKPGFSLVASYRMKSIKRSGSMKYQMNHYRTEKQSFAMTENIGDIYRRYGNDNRVFRAVTIDDPVFKQREIVVTLDGQDTATFTKHLNFVTVKMRKQHQSGETTNAEVVITPELFNSSGNAFTMLYGFKGDLNRDKWLEYSYQTVWSFHGGVEIRSSWLKNNTAMLALTPPHRYRAITIEGEGDSLQAAQVRHAVITINTTLNGKEITNTSTIKNKGPAPSTIIDIPEDTTNPASEVSIIWHLKGGKKVSIPPSVLDGDIVYWDELPKGGS